MLELSAGLELDSTALELLDSTALELDSTALELLDVTTSELEDLTYGGIGADEVSTAVLDDGMASEELFTYGGRVGTEEVSTALLDDGTTATEDEVAGEEELSTALTLLDVHTLEVSGAGALLVTAQVEDDSP